MPDELARVKQELRDAKAEIRRLRSGLRSLLKQIQASKGAQ